MAEAPTTCPAALMPGRSSCQAAEGSQILHVSVAVKKSVKDTAGGLRFAHHLPGGIDVVGVTGGAAEGAEVGQPVRRLARADPMPVFDRLIELRSGIWRANSAIFNWPAARMTLIAPVLACLDGGRFVFSQLNDVVAV